MNADLAPPPAAPRLGRTLLLAIGTIAVSVAVVAAVHFAAVWRGATFEDFSKDPTQTLDGPLYVGWFHYVVILAWSVPATAALLGASLLRRAGRTTGFRFLLVGGLLTAAMGLDDAFLLHDHVYQSLGVPQDTVFVLYGIATAAFGWWFRRRLRVDLLLVVAAFACWGVSIALDVLLDLNAPYVVEDGAKAVGVALWALLLVKHTVAELGAVLQTDDLASEPAAARHRRAVGELGDPADAPPANGIGSQLTAAEDHVRTEPVRSVVPAGSGSAPDVTRPSAGETDPRSHPALHGDLSFAARSGGPGSPSSGPSGWHPQDPQLGRLARNPATGRNGAAGRNGTAGRTGTAGRGGTAARNGTAGHVGSPGRNGVAGHATGAARHGRVNGHRRHPDGRPPSHRNS